MLYQAHQNCSRFSNTRSSESDETLNIFNVARMHNNVIGLASSSESITSLNTVSNRWSQNAQGHLVSLDAVQKSHGLPALADASIVYRRQHRSCVFQGPQVIIEINNAFAHSAAIALDQTGECIIITNLQSLLSSHDARLESGYLLL